MSRRFAEGTKVAVEKSRHEIETILQRYGADAFGYISRPDRAVIEFACHQRQIRFILPLPDRNDRKYQVTPGRGLPRGQEAALQAWEQDCRQLWRALALCIKAKLEAVEAGISEFENEFMANVVDPVTRQTMSELVRPLIAQRYLNGGPTILALPGPA